LLAALLRANSVPAALCYQRLKIGECKFGLHGLVAAYLTDVGWYRLDARGNKPGVNAQFSPPVEQLAFPVSDPGEVDSRKRHQRPLPEVIEAFRLANTVQELDAALPDRVSI